MQSQKTVNRLSSKTVTNPGLEYLKLRRVIKMWIENLLHIDMGINDVDLITSLQTGVILCKLMQLIDDRSVPKIHEVKITQTRNLMKRTENVTFFYML